VSIHPTMTNDEIFLICNGVKEIVENISEWQKDYIYYSAKNEYFHKNSTSTDDSLKDLFSTHENINQVLAEVEK
jgi:hypothetical protein